MLPTRSVCAPHMAHDYLSRMAMALFSFISESISRYKSRIGIMIDHLKDLAILIKLANNVLS